jgi:TonB-dependent starch-binding outer membrane protein SusC
MKKTDKCLIYNRQLKKVLITMKLTTLLIFVFSFNLFASGYAQETKINLSMKNATIKEVIEQIEEETDFYFMLKYDDYLLKKQVTLDYKQANINDILTQLFEKERYEYKIIDKYIAVRPIDEIPAEGQQGDITGKVTDSSGFPLPGVTVVVKNTTTGTVTNADGEYSLVNIPNDVILQFSFIGMKTQEMPVFGKTEINVVLVEEVIGIEEVVAIGYGVQKKEDATGAVDVLSSDSFNKGMHTSPVELLNGKTAGVQITQSSGAPGAGSSVRIRGINSITGSSEPLYVIDGVPVDNNRTSVSTTQSDNATSSVTVDPLSTISPSDIESITVLKDASATAIYGSRGANGVIIVTTKKGKEGKLSLTYAGSVGVSAVSNKIDLLSAGEYVKAVQNLASEVPVNDDPNNYHGYTSAGAKTDWQDEIFRTAITHKHDLSFSGGVEKFNYRFSAGYYKQGGIVDDTDYERLTARFSASQKMFDDKLKFDVNLNVTDYDVNNLPEQQTGGYLGGVLNNALKMDPTQPVRKADGTFNEYATDVRNPVALLYQTEDLSEGFRFIGSVQTTYNLADNLFVKLNLAKDNENSTRKIYHQKASSLTDQGRAIRENLQTGSDLMEIYLNYNAKIGSNNFSALAGHSYQKFYSDIVGVVGTGFATDQLGYNNLSADNVETTAFKDKNKLASFFVRANLDLGNRLLWTATLRADGSSKFAEGNRWGYFPSTAIAWKLANESFLRESDVISNLKLRVGIGSTGNQDIGNNLYMTNLALGSKKGFYFGDKYYAPISPTNIANPDLKWEKTTQTNIGFDFGLWNNRMNGSIDYYYKNTTNLLVEIPAVQPAVAATYLDNIGEMVNKGIELSANYMLISKLDFNIDLGFNISSNDNEVTKLYTDAEIYTGTISGAGGSGQIQLIKEGLSYGTFYGYKYLGTDATGNETFATADGSTTTDINQAQLQTIGKALPSMNYGFTASVQYKKWDVNVAFRGVSGNKIYNNTRAEIVQPDRIPGINTTDEATHFANANANQYRSSRWLEDGSYLRLDNITIGYNFGSIGKIKSLRVFATGQNLFVITSYSGYDPEVNTIAGNSAAKSIGIDYTNYPRARTITGGVSLNF